MDLAYLPPLPMGLISTAVRVAVFRAIPFVAAAQRRMPGWPVGAAFGAVSVAWLLNSMDWGPGEAGVMVAVCLASLVATGALVAGWSSEPEEIERWALRSLVAAIVSALPAFIAA